MKNADLLDEVLAMIRSIIDDRKRLEQLHSFLKNEILSDLEMNEEELIIPDEYRALVKEAASNLDANFAFYLNLDTLESYPFPKEILMDEDFSNYIAMTGDETLPEEMRNIENYWTRKILITPPESNISYTFMERFVNSLPESFIKIKLREAIEGRKPFRNFNHLIHESDVREDWFAFRQKCMEEFVTGILAESLWNDEADN